ncbi:MAG: hydrolase 1, exosortase A system-associated [Proteobacteria bacterium]|nr:MAG: hydrolase 1, exosortase A system-associated [Pseudomonadota bacterium]
MSSEEVVVFPGETAQLVGSLHTPETAKTTCGVLLAVGGPQTRTGSHRQFVLLARYLADNGVPVFRFDYTGMGDSEGEKTEFLQACPDLAKAIDVFLSKEGVDSVCFWGLCDAVSLGLMYLSVTRDQRIHRFIAANPWVRQTHTEAQAYLKSYYIQRLLNKELWLKIMKLQFDFAGSFSSLLASVKKALIRPSANKPAVNGKSDKISDDGMTTVWPEFNENNYVNAMLAGVNLLGNNFHLVLSGNDLTADEFKILLKSDRLWAEAIKEKEGDWFVIDDATHTFSSREWRDALARRTLDLCLPG